MKLTISTLALAFVLTCVSACSSNLRTRNGSIEGRVFLISKGGDSKPCRLCKVYLSDLLPNPTNAAAVEKFGGHFEELKLTERLMRRQNGNESGCREAFESQSRVIEIGSKRVETDEDGRFVISNVAPGMYELTASGQAGGYLAFWLQQLNIAPGQKLEMTLAAPFAACSLVRIAD